MPEPLILEYLGRTPTIDKSAYIAPGAVVIGRVSIGADASIWFNSVIRGDSDEICIGARSNIQDGSVLHVDPGFPLDIGNDVTVGHAAIVHAATIGDGVLIGMGATILTGATVGKCAVIAAGAVVKEGFEVPANALVVGVPGVVKKILPACADGKRSPGADHYVALAADYRSIPPEVE